MANEEQPETYLPSCSTPNPTPLDTKASSDGKLYTSESASSEKRAASAAETRLRVNPVGSASRKRRKRCRSHSTGGRKATRVRVRNASPQTRLSRGSHCGLEVTIPAGGLIRSTASSEADAPAFPA